MTPADLDRARRVVASPLWRWMPGMLDDDGNRVVGDDETAISLPQGADADRDYWTLGFAATSGPRHFLPDLTDPATLGCILALYLDARPTLAAPDPVLTLVAVYGLRDPRTVEALVAALEVWT